MYIRAATFLEIDDDLKTIEQDMSLDGMKNICGAWIFLFFALCDAVSRRNRLREHGRHTHPLRLAGVTRLVNPMRQISDSVFARDRAMRLYADLVRTP